MTISLISFSAPSLPRPVFVLSPSTMFAVGALVAAVVGK
jgi:hypothetical protein